MSRAHALVFDGFADFFFLRFFIGELVEPEKQHHAKSGGDGDRRPAIGVTALGRLHKRLQPGGAVVKLRRDFSEKQG